VLEAAGIHSGRIEGTGQATWIAADGGNPATSTAIVGNTSDGSPLSGVNLASWTSSALAEVKTLAGDGYTLLEVGNEMYLKGGSQNGAKYAEMYVSLHEAAAAEHVTLIFDGGSNTWTKEAVTAEPKLTTLVDAFSDHPYGFAHESRNGWEGPRGLEEQHAYAVSEGFAHATYYLTEYGIELNGPNTSAPTETVRVQDIKEAYGEFTGLPYVAGIWWYQSHNDSGNWGVVSGEGSSAVGSPALTEIGSFAGNRGALAAVADLGGRDRSAVRRSPSAALTRRSDVRKRRS